jgi:4-hydroxy-3-methylbut-2-enyl diphosphate reductase
MQITIAKSAGFCFGVERAVGMAFNEAKNKGGEGKKAIYTYGPIIHNDIVTEELEEDGVHIFKENETAADAEEGATIILRSHGVSKSVVEDFENSGKNITLIDATCPFVTKIHNIIRDESHKGNGVIIIGDPAHPEIEGSAGWCENEPIFINCEEDINKAVENGTLNRERKYVLVAQTTFNNRKFKELVALIEKLEYNIYVVNTICNATLKRQTECAELAKNSDAMIVIGDKKSSNSRKLFEIAQKECPNTFFIQKLGDLDLSLFKSFRSVGITAGASTPNNIIKEVYIGMSEMNDKEFEEALNETFKTIRTGEVVDGKVISVKPDEVVVNIGYKADGIITKNEFGTASQNADLTQLVHEGDEIKAKVLKLNDGDGQVVLSTKRLQAERVSKVLEDAFANKTVLKSKVTEVLTGGLIAIVDETKVFVPASLVSDTYEKDLSKYQDQEIEFVITEFNPKRRRIIGDRKQLVAAKKAEQAKELFGRINVGDIVKGEVKNITDFGVFVDLGGADGLLHISEMSWGRIEAPKKVFKVGDELEVMIKDIKGDRIALTLKFPDKNPWNNAEEKYAVGKQVTGKVARMADFGAFVELEPGIDALLHVSQISKNHIEKPADVLKVGDEVTAEVVNFDAENKRISISVKALTADEAPAEDAPAEETPSEN